MSEQSIPVASADEQAALAARAKSGDRAAMAGICASQNGLVKQIAVSYARQSPHVEIDDLIQEGYLAVMDAAKWFDPSKGFKFSTYAADCIRRRLFRYLGSRQVMPIGAQEDGGDREGMDGIEEAVRSFGGDVSQLLEQLSPAHQAIVRKRFGLGENEVGIMETAKVLGISVGQVRNGQKVLRSA